MATKKQEKRTYTKEFKETAIKLALTGSKPIAVIARELEIPEWKLRDWVRAWKNKRKTQQDAGKSSDERLKELEKRNKQLELENEILKKAAAYFAKTLL